MTKQIINVGSAEQSGDGESVRSAFIKINDNFSELYGMEYVTASTDWADTAPTTVGEALDRLASLIKSLNNDVGA